MTKTIGNVIAQENIATDIYSMIIETEIALSAKPGQFVSLFCKDPTRMLPRPISICSIDKKELTIELVYRIAGKGTKGFSNLTMGDKIEIMGPLGNGFPTTNVSPYSKVILIGGGIGIPPMIECAKALKSRGIERYSVMGYRNSETFLQDRFEELCNKTCVATEDGSVGTKGNVIDAIKAGNIKGDIIFACGPIPMLHAIKEYARQNNITCYISMEERMACGVGACLACVCKTKGIDVHSQVKNKRVCKDGPVFLAEDIDI